MTNGEIERAEKKLSRFVASRGSDWDVMQIVNRLREHHDLVRFLRAVLKPRRGSDWDVMQRPDRVDFLDQFANLEPSTREALRRMKSNMFRGLLKIIDKNSDTVQTRIAVNQ